MTSQLSDVQLAEMVAPVACALLELQRDPADTFTLNVWLLISRKRAVSKRPKWVCCSRSEFE
jgi:hypothetical protein